MSRLALLDRLQTIAATATVTSAVWVLIGAVWLGQGADTTAREPAGDARPASSVASAPGQPAVAAVERLAIPVLGVQADELTDTFAEDRGGSRHEAIDIMAPAGTPVVAAGPGTVDKLFVSEAGGNTIYVRSHDRRTIHYYAHLQGYAPGLAEGQAVQRGQRLGTVGATGNADPAAPHLHFAVLQVMPAANWWETTQAIDPYPLLVAQ